MEVADNTKVEWADATWSPVTGCTPVSAGCEHCYAKRLATRFPHVHGTQESQWPDFIDCIPFSQPVVHRDRMDKPLHWRKPRRVFVCSMGDLFHEDVSVATALDVLRIAASCPQHTFMILTKRPERMRTVMHHVRGITENIWLGVTAENQATADARLPILREIPAALRFVSCEPLLEEVKLDLTGIGWVIVGGETGPGARRMEPEWVYRIQDDCEGAGVPFFFKKWGGGNNSRLVYGLEWNEVPK
jgi:protein gp37